MEFLDSVWPAGIFFVAYTSLIFTIFHWMLKAQITSVKDQITAQITSVKDQITSVKDQITSVKDQITPVKELLSNHIFRYKQKD